MKSFKNCTYSLLSISHSESHCNRVLVLEYQGSSSSNSLFFSIFFSFLFQKSSCTLTCKCHSYANFLCFSFPFISPLRINIFLLCLNFIFYFCYCCSFFYIRGVSAFMLIKQVCMRVVFYVSDCVKIMMHIHIKRSLIHFTRGKLVKKCSIFFFFLSIRKLYKKV